MPDEILSPTASTPATSSAAPAAQPATPPAAPASPPSGMVTLEQAQAMANSAAAAARREAEGKQKPAPSQAPQPAPTQSPSAPSGFDAEAVARLVAFETGLIRHSLAGDVESKVRTLYAAEKPENVGEWLASTAKLFGGGAVSNPQPPAATAAPGNPSAPASPQVPAPIAPSAPSTAVPMERDVDIITMSAEQVHDLMRRKGAHDPSRPYDPKNRAAGREIRKAWEASLANKRVKLGSQK